MLNIPRIFRVPDPEPSAGRDDSPNLAVEREIDLGTFRVRIARDEEGYSARVVGEDLICTGSSAHEVLGTLCIFEGRRFGLYCGRLRNAVAQQNQRETQPGCYIYFGRTTKPGTEKHSWVAGISDTSPPKLVWSPNSETAAIGELVTREASYIKAQLEGFKPYHAAAGELREALKHLQGILNLPDSGLGVVLVGAGSAVDGLVPHALNNFRFEAASGSRADQARCEVIAARVTEYVTALRYAAEWGALVPHLLGVNAAMSGIGILGPELAALTRRISPDARIYAASTTRDELYGVRETLRALDTEIIAASGTIDGHDYITKRADLASLVDRFQFGPLEDLRQILSNLISDLGREAPTHWVPPSER